MAIHRIAAACAALIGGAACAQPIEDAPLADESAQALRFRSAVAYWDNDGTYAKPFNQSDNHYTNGLKLDLAWRPADDTRLAEFLRRPAQFADAKLAFGVVVAQHIYTGFDIQDRDPPSDDRPWAGYLYAGVYVQRATERVHDHFELDLGVVGQGSGAEGTQKFIHAAVPEQDRPLGWSNQLSNEFVANLRLARTWRSPVADVFGLELQALPRVSTDLGNAFVRAGCDITLRLGLHMPNDFGPGRLLDYRDATGEWSGEHDLGFYMFSRAGGRLVYRNIFLDGNTFQNSARTDKEFLVGEVELGFRLRWRAVELGWSVTWQTEEYERQDSPDSWGSWSLAFRF